MICSFTVLSTYCKNEDNYLCEKTVALLTHSYVRFEIHFLPVLVSSGYDKCFRVVHLQGQEKSLKQRESSPFCDRFYTEDFKNGCASSRYATVTFDFKFLAHFEWNNHHFFTAKSSSSLPLINLSVALTPLLKTTSFSRIYWLAIDLAAKAACGVQGNDACWPLKRPVVVNGLQK